MKNVRSQGKIAKSPAYILIKEEVENRMICDIRERFRPIPVTDEQEKEAFRRLDMIGWILFCLHELTPRPHSRQPKG